MQPLANGVYSPSVRQQGSHPSLGERRRLRDERQSFIRRVIEADEQQRTRIARDLHDDVAQRLFVLMIELSVLARDSPALPSGTSERLMELSALASAIASDLQRVTHELHPVVLEKLGLEGAVGLFCEELSRSRGLVVALEMRGLSHPLRPAVSLCAYRVLQEALHNVIRHSGVSDASVTITRTDDELTLVVADRGVGFDPDASTAQASLGLSNMRARVQLVCGRFLLHSRAGEGTRIEARVPLR